MDETPFQKLQSLFREIFLFDLADLDFGLYRLFHLKRAEIESFISDQLPREVDAAFAAIAEEERERLQRELEALTDKVRKQIAVDAILSNGEIHPDYLKSNAKVVRDLAEQYEATRSKAASIRLAEEQRSEVFTHLYRLFKRYYQDGDYIPKRRYGAREVYALPYNGEEVTLHWANQGQYYVKTTEHFQDYTFKVNDLLGEGRVRFSITKANIPKDNTKGNARYFFPLPNLATYDTATNEVILPFEYRLPTVEEADVYTGGVTRVQETILEENVPQILNAIPDPNLQALLSKPSGEGKNAPNVLLRHLMYFCRRNTRDYFIHKDLRGFLSRELEFYIKDQVIHLMDLEADFEVKRRELRIFRRLAEKTIDFLATIEDAQKILFEKKKFVLRTDYLVPIQHVPREFWPAILKNQEQLAEWKSWLAVEPTKNLFNPSGEINTTLLESHPTLPVHTRHFDGEFVQRLLETLPFENLDEATDGLLIHSENYQALRLLLERYGGQVNCVYIDPPFNGPSSEILYKNNYKHSSWLSLMDDRIEMGTRMLQRHGVQVIAVDEVEQEFLGLLLRQRFPLHENSCVTIVSNPSGQQGDNFSTCHEYAYFIYPKGGRFIGLQDRPERPDVRTLRDVSQGDHLRGAAANCFYPIFVKNGEIIGFGDVCDDSYHPGSPNILRDDGTIEVYPIDPEENERKWVWARGTVETIWDELEAVYNKKRNAWDIIRTKTKFNYKTVWSDTRYSANSYGSKLLNNILGSKQFSYPKSLYTVMDCIQAGSNDDREALILDYFAGSGTTGHAVMKLNCEDKGQRKFILVEMGEYFDTVLVPRIAKVMYAPKWEDGKPVRDATSGEAEYTPRLIKILYLEGYEDSLHNLVAPNTMEQVAAFDSAYKEVVGEELYNLRYWIKLPLREAETCLRSLNLAHPFAYSLEILTDDGPIRKSVDIVETFNYLYGLRVCRYETWRNPVDYNRDYRVVKAIDRNKKRSTLVIWRDMTGLDIEAERAFLETKIADMNVNGQIWDEILINGDSPTPGVESLNPVFKQLMMQGEEK